jgi:thymidine kinase
MSVVQPNLPGGYLELILGPMFSGKTTRLIELYHQLYNTSNIKVINYSGDTRYHSSMLSTHDKVMIPCIFTNKLSDVCEEKHLENIDVILINEGQFFPDLYEVVFNLVEVYKKRVYICGLDGDFKRKKFGALLDLIPICDKVIKLSAKCNTCKADAIFSHRITTEKQQVVIGSDNYVPLCRTCYLTSV